MAQRDHVVKKVCKKCEQEKSIKSYYYGNTTCIACVKAADAENRRIRAEANLNSPEAQHRQQVKENISNSIHMYADTLLDTVGTAPILDMATAIADPTIDSLDLTEQLTAAMLKQLMAKTLSRMSSQLGKVSKCNLEARNPFSFLTDDEQKYFNDLTKTLVQVRKQQHMERTKLPVDGSGEEKEVALTEEALQAMIKLAAGNNS